jgi:hypothetical protein
VRWTSAFVYLSAAVLVAAVVGELASWQAAVEQWLLLAWTVLLLPLTAALFRHPMRWPAWGLFLGFWGAVSVLTLIVLQSLAVAAVLQQPSRTFAESFPLAVLGLWVLVTSLLGGAPAVEASVSAPVAGVGAVAGVALIVASAIAWAGGGAPERPAFLVAAVAYVVWTAGLSGELWSWNSRRQYVPEPAPAPKDAPQTVPEPAPAPVTS